MRYLIHVGDAARVLATEEDLIAEARAAGVQKLTLTIDVANALPGSRGVVHGVVIYGPGGRCAFVRASTSLQSALLDLLAEAGVVT